MLSLVLDSLGFELPDLAVYHVAPQPAQGSLSVAACGAVADSYFGVEDADHFAGLNVNKCFRCLAHVVAWRSQMLFGAEPQQNVAVKQSCVACGATEPGKCDYAVPHPTAFASKAFLASVATTPPPESPVALALRTELRRLLDAPLTVSSLRRVARLVEASTKTLRAMAEGAGALLGAAPPRRPPGLGGMGMYGMLAPVDPDAVDTGDGPGTAPDFGYSGGPVIAASPPIETFGSGMLREGVAAFMQFMEKKEERAAGGRPRYGDLPPAPTMDPFRVQMLVAALASAKTAGLSGDTVKKLEDSLAKALEEPKVVPQAAEAFVSPSDYVDPTAPTRCRCLALPCTCDLTGSPEPAASATISGKSDETF